MLKLAQANCHTCSFFHETDCSSGNNIVSVISCYNQNLETAFPASAVTAQKLEQIFIILQKKNIFQKFYLNMFNIVLEDYSINYIKVTGK